MAAMSDYLRNRLLDHVLRAVVYTPPGTVYIALYTANPTSADVGTEVPTSGTAYARKAIAFSAAAAGASNQSALLTWALTTAGWGVVTHFGIRDALTAGNLLMYSPLTTPKTVVTGETPQMAIGAVVATLS